MKNKVLLVSIGYSPNVGGIETHFDDLTKALNKRDWGVTVLTYKPITTNVSAKFHENARRGLEIYRIPWWRGLFYTLVGYPVLEFIYLIPGLFFSLPFLLLSKRSQIDVIHSHGLIAGFVSVFWGKMFGKRVITTTHSYYSFPDSGLYSKLAKFIFDSSDHVLVLSEKSRDEVLKLGVSENKVSVFTYWIDTKNFKKITGAKKMVGWKDSFIVLFVGRLVPQKGVDILIKSFKQWNKNIKLVIAGDGPLKDLVIREEKRNNNLHYLGSVSQNDLPKYYSASDLLIVPSNSEEGFGRVIIESLFCGTPVIGADRGAIPEAINKNVGSIIKITKKRIANEIEKYYKDQDLLSKKSEKAIKFAKVNYSEKNVETIIKAYKK